MTYVKHSVGESNWNDIVLSGNSLRSGNSAPDPINHPAAATIQIYGFDGGNTLEQLDGSAEIVHDYKETTAIHPNVHWCPTTAATGVVVWNMDLAYADVNGTHISGAVSGSSAASGTGYHTLTSLNSWDITGLHIGAVICFRLFRNPTISLDTYPGDAGLLSVGIHYESDTMGSRYIGSK